MTNNRVSLSLPKPLIKRVERRLELTEFDSAEEYVQYVLEEVLEHAESADSPGELDSADEEHVRERLKTLGYLG